ncbi:tetratricopeptide repeat protein [Novosphingobium sp. 1949]|uniref:Tetratricopeptide repeat protein n=1 Tax=Novosphingobium organovorum TaxID=2930092 RepID=A0ABT0BCU8_9SPHN|nr:tetratricopeptide repeat protein [Novosphingobium organovorum]MCJ2182626.1 tetratricopeptide repeat protein [Novosphingobium organovorum]
MRYSPAALAVCLAVAVSSSMLHSQVSTPLDPRAVTLLGEGKASLAAGRPSEALDAFEAALAVAPGSTEVLVALADAERDKGLQGKAIHYYRVALKDDPRNLSALAGEGVALAQKGATEKAGLNLSRLKTLCGADCAQARQVAAAIAKGPEMPQMVAADTVKTKPAVSEN